MRPPPSCPGALRCGPSGAQFNGQLSPIAIPAAQAFEARVSNHPLSVGTSLARIRQPPIVPPTGWLAFAPHASSGSNGIVTTALSRTYGDDGAETLRTHDPVVARQSRRRRARPERHSESALMDKSADADGPAEQSAIRYRHPCGKALLISRANVRLDPGDVIRSRWLSVLVEKDRKFVCQVTIDVFTSNSSIMPMGWR
jgi:hypothetical protein